MANLFTIIVFAILIGPWFTDWAQWICITIDAVVVTALLIMSYCLRDKNTGSTCSSDSDDDSDDDPEYHTNKSWGDRDSGGYGAWGEKR